MFLRSRFMAFFYRFFCNFFLRAFSKKVFGLWGPSLFENYSKCRIWIFEFWHFPHIFVLLKLTCLVTLFDRKLQVFKNSPKWTIFGIFKCKRSSLRSQCWMRLFFVIFKHRDFSSSLVIIMTILSNIPTMEENLENPPTPPFYPSLFSCFFLLNNESSVQSSQMMIRWSISQLIIILLEKRLRSRSHEL